MGIIAVLIVIGLVLLFLETLLPGLIAGTLGVIALGAAILYSYMTLGVKAGNLTLLLVLVLMGAGTVLWVKFFPNSPVARRFVSERQIGNVGAGKPELIGQTGVTLTDLRPAGTAVFAGKRVDVVADGTFVEKGRNVRVVDVEGARVVVRLIDPA